MNTSNSQQTVWVLADDRAGNVNQATGLAEALELPFETKKIGYNGLVRLPNFLRGQNLIGTDKETAKQLVAPWPALVISAGRRCAPVARYIKKQNPATKLVHLMDTGPSLRRYFDLVVLPVHDNIKDNSRNIMRTVGALHRITPQRLEHEQKHWQPVFAHLQAPYLGVIVGGATKNRPFTTKMAEQLAENVKQLAKQMGNASLLVTTSRRTGEEQTAIIKNAFKDIPNFFYGWGDEGENPYFGFLSCSDSLVVTGDSVSMCTECCATQAPVYIFAPGDMAAPKHARLHQALYSAKVARPLDEQNLQEADATSWTHEPLNDMPKVAQAVRNLLS